MASITKSVTSLLWRRMPTLRYPIPHRAPFPSPDHALTHHIQKRAHKSRRHSKSGTLRQRTPPPSNLASREGFESRRHTSPITIPSGSSSPPSASQSKARIDLSNLSEAFESTPPNIDDESPVRGGRRKRDRATKNPTSKDTSKKRRARIHTSEEGSTSQSTVNTPQKTIMRLRRRKSEPSHDTRSATFAHDPRLPRMLPANEERYQRDWGVMTSGCFDAVQMTDALAVQMILEIDLHTVRRWCELPESIQYQILGI